MSPSPGKASILSITLILSTLILSAGCTSQGGEGLEEYLLTSNDVSSVGAVTNESTSHGTNRVERSWGLVNVSDLDNETTVIAALHDVRDQTSVIEDESNGWNEVDKPGIGQSSVLLASTFHTHPCGYKVIVQRGSLVSVVEVRLDCEEFKGNRRAVMEYALELARRQATILRGYPHAA